MSRSVTRAFLPVLVFALSYQETNTGKNARATGFPFRHNRPQHNPPTPCRAKGIRPARCLTSEAVTGFAYLYFQVFQTLNPATGRKALDAVPTLKKGTTVPEFDRKQELTNLFAIKATGTIVPFFF